MNQEPTWIHIAGNPPGVIERRPPYWRYRLGLKGEEKLFDSLSVNGVARSTNAQQGIEFGASFLLWQGFFGTATAQAREDTTHLSIELCVPNISDSEEDAVANEVQLSGRILVYGAPDLVRRSSPHWWRARVNDTEVEIPRFEIVGNITEENFRLGDNVHSDDPLRRLWLEFSGNLHLSPASTTAVLRLS